MTTPRDPAAGRLARKHINAVRTVCANWPSGAPLGGDVSDHRCAMIAGHLVIASRLIGERPNTLMARIDMGAPIRWYVRHVKGQAGDALRALNANAKKKPRRLRRTPEEQARHDAEMDQLEKDFADFDAMVAGGMSQADASAAILARQAARAAKPATAPSADPVGSP